MEHRIYKELNIEFTGWIRNIKNGVTILPYLCFDKSCCTGRWELNIGWIVFACRIRFAKQ